METAEHIRLFILYFQVKNKSNQSYITVTLMKCSCYYILVTVFDCQLVINLDIAQYLRPILFMTDNLALNVKVR